MINHRGKSTFSVSNATVKPARTPRRHGRKDAPPVLACSRMLPACRVPRAWLCSRSRLLLRALCAYCSWRVSWDPVFDVCLGIPSASTRTPALEQAGMGRQALVRDVAWVWACSAHGADRQPSSLPTQRPLCPRGQTLSQGCSLPLGILSP